MTNRTWPVFMLLLAAAVLSAADPAFAQDAQTLNEAQAAEEAKAEEEDRAGVSGKLLLTGGVTELEGAAGGGLTPWAVIGGYGTRDQIGANAFYTRIDLPDYHLDSYGVLLGIHDRFEFSLARQSFDTENVGAQLGLGRGFSLDQDVIGVKVRLLGDAVLDQDRAMPQLSIGLQHKRNRDGAVVRAVGARSDNGTDAYLSATKLLLARGLLLNGTVRFTKANQLGLLGFGGDRHDRYRPEFEASAAYLLNRKLAVGVEYRSKPDNLRIAAEDDAWDVFVAWAPLKSVSLTVAYVDLGNIVIADDQRGIYASLQAGF